MVLVTGATGFIGGCLARALAAEGADLRLLVRRSSDRRTIQDLRAPVIEGDLRDRASLDRAVRGCSRLFHVAADYRLWTRGARDRSALYAANVDGTRNLLAAAAEAGVERIVYTSTVGTIGVSEDGPPSNEASPVQLADMTGDYKRSKFLAEQVALDFARKGLPVVIVNPTAPVGERDWKPTPTGKIIVDFLRGRMPAYLDTGLNLVDVRDVAQGHLSAAENGRPGERYLLGACNMTLQRILQTLAELSGRPAPRLRLPYSAAWTFAALETAWSRVSGREPRAPLEAVRMARKKMFVNCRKAQRELDFRPGPVEDALGRAIEWFQANQYC